MRKALSHPVHTHISLWFIYQAWDLTLNTIPADIDLKQVIEMQHCTC